MATLANKYRPLTFNDVVEQKSTVTILTNQLSKGTYSNCYLFYGPSGCGKTTLARILASQLNGGPTGIHEIDAGSQNGVDEIRRLQEEAVLREVGATYRIYIIDEAHMLTTNAWNALFISCPAFPTKGSPCLSSSAPGPSPISITSASLLPTPNTIFVLFLQSLHFLHPLIACSNSSQLLYISFHQFYKF